MGFLQYPMQQNVEGEYKGVDNTDLNRLKLSSKTRVERIVKRSLSTLTAVPVRRINTTSVCGSLCRQKNSMAVRILNDGNATLHKPNKPGCDEQKYRSVRILKALARVLQDGTGWLET